ncbi:hypothetical protein [Nesterenkonia muleiensis]|uniref:hypothetical protein n=1 Tax=Nesterenkonia muleiensis TaxID=2282648 RepID=UPI001300A47E|nr:hypothetical protein [Nesterenkonia muleiensis]
MKKLQPLPEALRGRVFTRAWAHQHEVDEHRLYARDIRLVGRGLYEHLLRPGQQTDRSMLLSALCDKHRGVRVSHATAAEVWGLAIPNRLTSDQVIHLSVRQDFRLNLRGYQVVMHRPRMTDGETLRWRGMRLSHPLRVAVDLKDRLSVVELVILLDQLLREPRPGIDPRQNPWTTREGLEACLSEHRGAQGITSLREAVLLARVGADSPAESRLRLAIVQGGLPEPELQIRLNPLDRRSRQGDMGYRDQKIVLQYEGEHHFTPEQQVADQRRNAAFEARVDGDPGQPCGCAGELRRSGSAAAPIAGQPVVSAVIAGLKRLNRAF